jgi:hypothetical protein
MNKQDRLNNALKTLTDKVEKLAKSKLSVSIGNTKLNFDTMIINMGTAQECPSKALGICNAINSGVKCYALKAEQLYSNNVPTYRQNQFKYWRFTTATTIANDIINKISLRQGKPIKYIRFNEAGDAWDIEDFKKLNIIAKKLKNFNITTYGYTARKDLMPELRKFKELHFLVKGSGFTENEAQGINGITAIINKKEELPEGYFLCPGSCKTCDVCMKPTKQNIAFIKH